MIDKLPQEKLQVTTRGSIEPGGPQVTAEQELMEPHATAGQKQNIF